MRKKAFNLYLVFLLSWFLHLTARVPALGAMRLDLILLVVITGMILASSEESPGSGDPTIRKLILTIAGMAVVTVPFVEWPGTVLRAGLPDFIKAFVFFYFTAELVTTERQVKLLMLVFLLGQSFRVVEPLYLHVTQGYWGSITTMYGDDGLEVMDRLAGAPNDVVNSNGLAFIILTIIPFFNYIGPISRTGTLLYLAFLPVGIYTLMLTASRSGMLGLGITILMMWWKTKHKVLFTTVMVVGALVAASSLSADLADRYESIFSSHTKNATTSQGRIAGVQKDLTVAMRRPIFGHGLGTSLEANAHFAGEAQPSHNLYTEVAQELGFVGLALFVAFLWKVARNVSRTLKALRASGLQDGIIFRLSQAVQVWFGMNLLFSFASYGLTSYEWYFLAGLAEVLRRFTPDPKGAAPMPQAAPAAAAAGGIAAGGLQPAPQPATAMVVRRPARPTSTFFGD